MAADEEKTTTTNTPNITIPTTTPTAKKTAKAPAAKKRTATSKTASRPATKPATKSTPAKGVNVKKTTTSKPSAPLKAGATRAASTANSVDNNSDLKGRAINTVRSAANEGRSIAGEAIGSLSEMIESSAKSLDANLGEKYGNYARSAADSVSSFANKVNSKDVDEMVEDARDFVRKKPAIAIGAAAVVGLLVSRLIKSGMDDNK